MKHKCINRQIGTALCTVILAFLSAQSSSFSDSSYSSNDLEKARFSLLSHRDGLEKQYNELSKNYQHYLELAEQSKKQMDLIENAAKQDDEALRSIEDALKSHP